MDLLGLPKGTKCGYRYQVQRSALCVRASVSARWREGGGQVFLQEMCPFGPPGAGPHQSRRRGSSTLPFPQLAAPAAVAGGIGDSFSLLVCQARAVRITLTLLSLSPPPQPTRIPHSQSG